MNKSNVFLYVLWGIGLLYLVLVIANSICYFVQIDSGLYAAVGIIISAFIASASVMRSISHSHDLDQKKNNDTRDKKRSHIRFYLKQILIPLEARTTSRSYYNSMFGRLLDTDSMTAMTDEEIEKFNKFCHEVFFYAAKSEISDIDETKKICSELIKSLKNT